MNRKSLVSGYGDTRFLCDICDNFAPDLFIVVTAFIFWGIYDMMYNERETLVWPLKRNGGVNF